MSEIKVLIVDDEVEFAETLAERLGLRDIAAETVNNGKDALATILIRPPDVVILDLKMPDLSGLEVLDGIKAHDPSIEVIMLTGHGSTSSGIEGMERGAFDYIMKPIDLDLLLEKINQAYEQRNTRKEQP
ncbi:MAG: response regulator [Thermodesulfobacteriota bacterium]|jgi:DNA-binding NtrC family response regulator